MLKNCCLSVSVPSDVNRERTGPRSVGAELTQGGGAKPDDEPVRVGSVRSELGITDAVDIYVT
jgi:hypothetical protein